MLFIRKTLNANAASYSTKNTHCCRRMHWSLFLESAVLKALVFYFQLANVCVCVSRERGGRGSYVYLHMK